MGDSIIRLDWQLVMKTIVSKKTGINAHLQMLLLLLPQASLVMALHCEQLKKEHDEIKGQVFRSQSIVLLAGDNGRRMVQTQFVPFCVSQNHSDMA